MRHRLFEVKLEILDDSTFTNEQMVANIHEALKVHLECLGLNVELNRVSFVLLEDNDEMAEA
jgi:hypothetical protein